MKYVKRAMAMIMCLSALLFIVGCSGHDENIDEGNTGADASIEEPTDLENTENELIAKPNVSNGIAGDSEIVIDNSSQTDTGDSPEPDTETDPTVPNDIHSDTVGETEENHGHTHIVDESLPEKYAGGLVISTLRKTFDEFNAEYSYIDIKHSEENYDILVRNPKGESVTFYANEDVMIKDKNHKAVYYQDPNVAVNTDVDNVDMMELAIRAVEDEFATMHVIDLSETYGYPLYEFVIDINGYDNCRRMYSYISEEFGDTMVTYLKSSSNDSGFNPSEYNLNIRFAYVLDLIGVNSGGFYIYYGDEAVGVDADGWNECYTLWYFNNWHSLEAWEFPEKWYNIDFDTVLKNKDIDAVMLPAEEICAIINERAQDYYDKLVESSIKIDS